MQEVQSRSGISHARGAGPCTDTALFPANSQHHLRNKTSRLHAPPRRVSRVLHVELLSLLGTAFQPLWILPRLQMGVTWLLLQAQYSSLYAASVQRTDGFFVLVLPLQVYWQLGK